MLLLKKQVKSNGEMILITMITIVNLLSLPLTKSVLFFPATYNPSLAQPNTSMTVITDTKSIPNKSRKGNKSKVVPNTIETTRKNSKIDLKKPRIFVTSTGLTSKPIEKISTPSNKTPMKSVTNAVISYLHYRGSNGGHVTGREKNGEIITSACLA